MDASGSKCEIEVVSDEVALEYLYKELNEEIGEIADVMEVLFAIAMKTVYSED